MFSLKTNILTEEILPVEYLVIFFSQCIHATNEIRIKSNYGSKLNSTRQVVYKNPLLLSHLSHTSIYIVI